MGVLTQRGFKPKANHAASEMDRILSLPLIASLLPEELEAVSKYYVLGDYYAKGWRLFPPQAEGITTYKTTAGLFGPIGVGWGKQLLCDMIAQAAYEKGLKKILMLVPAEAYNQVWHHDLFYARQHVNLSVPFIGLGRKEQTSRSAIAKSGRPGCYVLPYSCMSVKNTDDVLEGIAPELIICDEAHMLRERRSARTRRFLAYCDEHDPEVVALSGTITSTTIRDYYHLLKLCCRQNTPLPLTVDLVNQWSAVLDSRVEPGFAQKQQLEPLRRWAHKNGVTTQNDIEGYRKSYQRRLTTAQGVVATGDADIGVGLLIANVPVLEAERSPGWAELERLMLQVSMDYLTPNGDIIDHAIHTYKWMWELSAGFYNNLTWPSVETLAERKNISIESAKGLLKRSQDYHKLGQIKDKEQRDWLKDYAFSGCDTPMLVGRYMSVEGAPRGGGALYAAWCDWHAAADPALIVRDKQPVRVCPYKVDHAVQWARGLDAGGLIWVDNIEIGVWVAERLLAAGLDTLHANAGEISNAAIIDPSNASKVCVASLNAHGQSKNLQYNYSEQLFLQWPRGASDAEQAIGRTHRNGQTVDTLCVVTTNTTEFDECNFAACLNDSLYIHQTTGVRQRLIFAGYDPLPTIFPSEVLKERGFENKLLNPVQRQMLLDKFTGKEE